MRASSFPLLLVLWILFRSGLVSAHEDEALKGLQFAFEVQVVELGKKTDERRAVLFGQYATAIESRQKAFQEAGDLENALKARDEATVARVEGRTGLDVFPAIQGLRETLRRELGKIGEEESLSRAALAAEYVKALAARQTELTKAGKLEEALAIKQRIDTLETGAAGAGISTGLSPQPSRVFKSLEDIGRVFGIGTDLSGGGAQVREANEKLLKEVTRCVAAWTLRVEAKETVPTYGNTRMILGRPEKVRLGNREFSCRIRVHHDADPLFEGREPGSDVAFAGRIAHCRISTAAPDVLLLEVANAAPPKAGALSSIPPVSDLEVVAVTWGPKDVTDIIQQRVVDDREVVRISIPNLGDPLPGRLKLFIAKYRIGGQDKSFTWERGDITLAAFFQEQP